MYRTMIDVVLRIEGDKFTRTYHNHLPLPSYRRHIKMCILVIGSSMTVSFFDVSPLCLSRTQSGSPRPDPRRSAGWCWGRMWGVTPSRDRRAGLETSCAPLVSKQLRQRGVPCRSLSARCLLHLTPHGGLLLFPTVAVLEEVLPGLRRPSSRLVRAPPASESSRRTSGRR
jgi:hypothetical protein